MNNSFATPLPQRRLGDFSVSAIGLGCMNLSHAYGQPPSFDDAAALLLRALDAGVTHFDTAALYGFGTNEELVGRVLAPHRHRFMLASKCGMTGVNGVRVIDGRPETIKATCEAALKRLRTDVIDLYYLHRWDKQVPIEDSVGALAELVRAGKIPRHRPERGLGRHAEARARGAPDHGGAERVFALVTQRRVGRAAGLRRAGRGDGGVQPGRARLPGRHLARHRRLRR